MFDYLIASLAGIVLLGIICQWLAWWLKLPAILFLLPAGIAVGPWLGWIDPDALFGDLLFPFVSLGVGLILFEGSLRLEAHEIAGEPSTVVRRLVTLGALTNLLVMGLAARWLAGLSWELAFLFAAVVTVTGPTVILPMLRTVRPNEKIARILRWEGIIIDPLGAVLAVLVFSFIVSEQEAEPLLVFVRMVITGVISGAIAALFLGGVLRRHVLPHYLVNVTTLATVLGVFALSHLIQHESGLLAVTVMGIMLANMKNVPVDEVVDFKESLSIMLISVVFIVLAARVRFEQFEMAGWVALGLLAVIMFVARPLAVFLCTRGSGLSWRERVLLSWMAPRGIVAAAVAALFSLRLEGLGFAQVELLVPLTFTIILGTVILQSASAGPLANMLGVSEPDPKGVLIVGSNAVARAIGKALADKGFRVMVADTDWYGIRAARMAGLSTYFGNAVSEHADRHLDLVGIGHLFAMSSRSAVNALACTRYKNEFGAKNVYALQTPEEEGVPEDKTIARPFSCSHLFEAGVTYSRLVRSLSDGAEIRSTHLTENFDFNAWREKYHGEALPLFALNNKGGFSVFAEDFDLSPKPGWSIIAVLSSRALHEDRTVEEKSAARKSRHIRSRGRNSSD